MPRPQRSDSIEAELDAAIDAVVASGRRPNFSNVAAQAKRARGLLSREDTAYRLPRDRILQIAGADRSARPKHDRACRKATPRLERPRRTVPPERELERRMLAASATIASLLVALSAEPASRSTQELEARLAARASRHAAEAAHGPATPQDPEGVGTPSGDRVS